MMANPTEEADIVCSKSFSLEPLPERPLVSIIVPSYNQGVFIRETLESILSQSYRPLELLVIDGASTDETLSVLKTYGDAPELQWWSEPDSGVVEAVNKGFGKARGTIGAIQSSDDFYFPGAIETGVRELRSDHRLGLIFGDIAKVDAHGRERMTTKLGPCSLESLLSVQTWIPQPSCLFRLELANRLGGWREKVPYAPDTDLWFRMLLHASGKKVDATLAGRREHDAQRDREGERIIRDYTRMVRDLFSISGAPTDLLPAAEAGIMMVQNRYGYGEPARLKQSRLRQAARAYPPLRRTISIPSVVPGLDRLKSLWTRLGRRLGHSSQG